MIKKSNKRADISITILVLTVVVLCIFALLSFYYVGSKRVNGKVNSVFYLEHVYNTAESVIYSGGNLYKNYETDNIKIKYTGGNEEEKTPGDFEINGEFFSGDLKIRYRFKEWLKESFKNIGCLWGL